jgi:hypothetical protein
MRGRLAFSEHSTESDLRSMAASHFAAEAILPPICVRSAEHRLLPRDLVQLELLRKGLDGISYLLATRLAGDGLRRSRVGAARRLPTAYAFAPFASSMGERLPDRSDRPLG